MNDFFVLKLLDRLRGVFTRIGVDYPVLRTILQVKLTMDGRRTPTVFSGSQSKQKETDSSPFRVQWFYLLLGLMMILMVIPKENYILMMGLLFSVVMFMIMSTLISDFSSVMLDLRDKNILFSKPVNRRTLSMAKSMHILIYLLTITLTFTGPSLIASLFIQGPLFFLIYGAAVILMDCFILVFTALLYLIILRFFDGEKLKDMINYVQILLSVGVTLGSQLIPRLFDITALGLHFKTSWWNFLIPPIWFSAPFEWLVAGTQSLHLAELSLLGLIVPLVLLAVYIMLMPSFERSLQKLAEQGAGGRDNGRWSRLLSGIFCRNREEGMFFRFTWSMMKNERDFKLKVYPSIGLSMVLPFIFIFNQVWSGNMTELRSSNAYLFIYLSSMLLLTAVQMLRYSASYKGAWIYKAIPLPEPAAMFGGMLKAMLLRLLLPLFAVEAAIFLWFFGGRIVDDLFVVLLALLLYAVICYRLLPQALPFSEKYEAAKQGDFKGVSFILLFILIGFAGVHYLFTLFFPGIYIYLAILAAVNWWVWRVTFTKAASSDRKIPTLGA